jgi:hypothetical protein
MNALLMTKGMLRRRLLRQQLLGRSLPSFSPRISNQIPCPILTWCALLASSATYSTG